MSVNLLAVLIPYYWRESKGMEKIQPEEKEIGGVCDWRPEAERSFVAIPRALVRSQKHGEYLNEKVGGGGGIRTHGTLARTTVFETAPFDHSGTPPHGPRTGVSLGR